ncbi:MULTISPECIES: hypothetical protein [Listeria]|nr:MULTISPECIES: hypothetical protein [Listeria]
MKENKTGQEVKVTEVLKPEIVGFVKPKDDERMINIGTCHC